MLVVHAALRRTGCHHGARLPLEQATHLHADPGEIAEERRTLALDEPEVGERDGEARVRLQLARIRPAELASRLGSRGPIELTCAEQGDEEMKTARRGAAHLVYGDGSEIAHAIAGLLEELPASRVLETFMWLHVAARKEPRAGERPSGLLHDEHTSRVVDAADDRAHTRARGHGRYGFFVGVGTGVRVGGTKLCVGPGDDVRVGTGVGVGDDVGHGSGLARFQVYRP